MDSKTSQELLAEIRERRSKQASTGFADAVGDMAGAQLKADAMRDVRNVALATLGAGAAGRGVVGLLNVLRGRPKKTRSGPTVLPLPYPAETPPAMMPPIPEEEKVGGFLAGDAAATKSGIPWYMPAMMLGGLGGLGLGWKGVDAIINRRRKADRESELNTVRQEFHDALLGQYDAPIKVPSMNVKKAGDDTMQKVGEALDRLYDQVSNTFAALHEPRAPLSALGGMKRAVDWANLAGGATGAYGTYAGLASLMTGALVYDKMKKRSRRAVLEKALQRRQRRQFMQSPTEIYAVPEPVSVEGAP